MQVKGAWYPADMANRVVVETVEGELRSFILTPFREVRMDETEPYKGHHPAKTSAVRVAPYLWGAYGLKRVETSEEAAFVATMQSQTSIDLDAVTVEYSEVNGTQHVAVQLPWAMVETILGHKHTGDADEDEILVRVLREAGAPAWVDDAPGWVDERGWGLVGPEMTETEDD